MHRDMRITFGVLALLAGALVGCQPEAEFPIEPALAFKAFTQHGDSASLVVAFTDGDGDIGLDDSYDYPPFDTLPYYYNLFIEYYRLIDGDWEDEPVSFAIPIYYRVPVVTPTGQNKALEGEVAVALGWPVIPGTEGDTVRLSAQLVDRALHLSNVVLTDPIVIQ